MSGTPPIPSTMHALELQAYGGELRLVEKPVPTPGHGEVLVRMAAAPMHPADQAFIRGEYGVRKPLPVVPGVEGSGIVVAAGSGLMPRAWLGRRVACSSSDKHDGTWAEYMVTNAMVCVPLLPSVTLEQGAMMLVNPLTAWIFMQQAQRGHRAAANTAAASALGQMLLRRSLKLHYPMVHIVRRQAQVDLLRGMGAEYVLNSSEPDFDAQMREMFHKLKVTLAFDAIAGAMTGRLLDALPLGGNVVVYGGLSDLNLQAGASLIFDRKTITGFWLANWLKQVSLPTVLQTTFAVQRRLSQEFQTPAVQRVPLDQAISALQSYTQVMTGTKPLIVFQ